MKLQSYIFLLVFLSLIPFSHSSKPFSANGMAFTSENYYSIYIMDRGKSSINDLQKMLQFYNPQIEDSMAYLVAKLYIEESIHEGINHDIAFCQMVLETGFLKYGGSVREHQNNFCGLGAVNEYSRGESFPDINTGIRAHIQHLKAYASFEDITKDQVDNRFKYVKRGSAQTIYALKGKWAMDPLYDQKIIGLLERLFFIRQMSHSQYLVSNIEF